MTDLLSRAAPSGIGTTRSARGVADAGAAAQHDGHDPALETLWAITVVGVVAGNWLLHGAVDGSRGRLAEFSELQHLAWLTPVSWVVPPLAVLFLVQGHATAKSYARAQSRGVSYREWLGRRLSRLFGPVAWLLGLWTPAAIVMLALGVDIGMLLVELDIALSSLWFLPVLALFTAVTPIAARIGPLWPIAVVLHVDVIRLGVGALDWLGWVNAVVGWLVPFGLGAMWARDGFGTRRAGWLLLTGGSAAAAGLVVRAGGPVSTFGVTGSTTTGPNLAAVSLGLVQCGLALLLYEPLRRATSRRTVRMTARVVGRADAAILAWHQTAMLAVTTGLLALGPLPGLHTTVDGPRWLIARLCWFPAFALALAVCRAAFCPPAGADTTAQLDFPRPVGNRLMDELDHTERMDTAVKGTMRGALHTVRKDLFTLAPQPMPPMSGPSPLRWLPHLAVVAVTVLAAHGGTEDISPRPVGMVHAALLVLALRWPVPAWWLSLVMLPVFSLHQPFSAYEGWAWAVHAGLLFLIALRNPLRVMVETVLLSTVLLLGLQVLGGGIGPWRFVVIVLVMFALAVAAAIGVRRTREVRTRLAEQESAIVQERARRTVLEERARIARELHDVVAHHMSVISIQADAAPYRVADPPKELVTALADIRAGALEGLVELRHLLGVLRSEDHPDSNAPEAPQPTLERLDGLLAGVRTAGLDVTVVISAARRPLPEGVELSAFRIVQEALSNTLRHAPGATARVELTYSQDALHLRILNSPGLQTAQPSPGAGHGVLGMRERAAMLGGELSAGPTPHGGYEVTALLPVPAAPTARTDREQTA
ncbi:histidine kinase [Streptomyces sp. NBC_00191]|uniref:histidine kinase n=1 Tax=Streptomyces sp. NBC_00191 TaxID=2975674 RepID=UPI00324DCA0A